MKRFAVTLFFVFATIILHAQQWVKEYGDTSTCTKIRSGIIDSDGFAVMVGGHGLDGEPIRPFIVRIDSKGNDSTYWFDEQYECISLEGIVQLGNDNYFIAGSVRNYSTDCSDAFVVMVLDKDMNIIKFVRCDNPENVITVQSQSLFLDDDGTVVLSGGMKYPSSISTNYYYLRPFFYRFDENANILQSRIVTTDNAIGKEAYIQDYERPQILKDPNSEGYIILADGINNVFSVLLYDRDFNFAGGNYLHVPLSLDFFGGNSSYMLSNDRLLLFCELEERFETTSKMALADVGIDGEINSYVPVCIQADTSHQNAFYQSTAYANDTTMYGLFFFYKSLGDFHTGVCLFDKNMELLGWKRVWSTSYDMAPSSILTFPDGSCVIAMFIGRRLGGSKILKFSREDFNPIPCSVSKIPEEQLQALAFPNPASDEIHFDISNLPICKEHRISICDVMGRTVMSRIIRGEGNVLTVGIADFEPGIYTYCIFNSQTIIVNGKFVKE